MNLKYCIFILVFLGVSALQCTTAQSTLNIISSDSTQLSLKVNDELLTDSFTTEMNLEFPTQKKVYLEFLDSADQSILKKTIALQPQITSDYTLFQVAGNYTLNLLAQSKANQPPADESAMKEMASSDLGINAIDSNSIAKPIIIKSEFNNPDEKQKVVLNSIDSYRFEHEKVKAVKQVLLTQKLSNNLINQALLKISYEDKRAEIILELKDKLKGKISKKDLNTLFKLKRYQTAAAEALEIQ